VREPAGDEITSTSGGVARTFLRRRQRQSQALLFMGPALLVMAGTLVFPIAYNIWLSLHRFNLTRLYEGQRFIGITNFTEALGSEHFWNALGNSLLITGGGLLIEIPIGFLLALAVHRRVRGRAFFQFVFLLPLLLVPAVVAFMWRFMFQFDGVINYLLEVVGLGRMDWSTSQMGLLSIIIVVTWQNTPFAFVVLLAGLQAINPEVEEAAAIDGAGYWQRFWQITLPLTKPFLVLVLTIRTMDLLRVFDEGYVLTRGGPGRSTETLSQLAYTNSFTFFDIGRGATLSLIQTAIIIGFIIVYFLVLQRGRVDAP
jgi:multiple sugar transport system permease protein